MVFLRHFISEIERKNQVLSNKKRLNFIQTYFISVANLILINKITASITFKYQGTVHQMMHV